MTNYDYPRLAKESDDEYRLRICSMKDQIGTWDDVANIINAELGVNYNECVYRKSYAAYQKLAAASQLNLKDASDILEDIKEQRRELEKDKTKFRDERNEVARMMRSQARYETMLDAMKKCICAEQTDTYPNVVQFEGSGKDMIIHLTDIHGGAGIDNAFNKYDIETVKQRLANYLAKIYDIAGTHAPEKVHIVLGGDLISGLIHTDLRVSNNENVVEQVKSMSEILSWFVLKVYSICKYIDVYSVSGNHSRIFPDKNEAIKGEDLDSLIPFYMKAKLANYETISVNLDKVDDTFGMFTVRNSIVAYAHGDKDTPTNVVQRMTMLTRQQPDIVLLGHRHTNGLTTVYDTKVVESGCVCGCDDYALGIRLRDKPEQMVLIVDDNGLDCLYDVKLEK